MEKVSESSRCGDERAKVTYGKVPRDKRWKNNRGEATGN